MYATISVSFGDCQFRMNEVFSSALKSKGAFCRGQKKGPSGEGPICLGSLVV
jgi:hypothetical protein